MGHVKRICIRDSLAPANLCNKYYAYTHIVNYLSADKYWLKQLCKYLSLQTNTGWKRYAIICLRDE